MTNSNSILEVFNAGGVFAYPAEAVFGLGCDPDNPLALEKLLSLKQRDKSKGLILIAADYAQLLPYIDDKAISQHRRFEVLSKWPGPVTWVIPCSKKAQPLLTGEHTSVAVRVPAFEPMRELCRIVGKPIVSTSANLSGMPSCLTHAEVCQQFGDSLDLIIDGNTQGAASPSQIYDAITGKRYR